jgi:nucleoside phosphorylase
MGVFTGPLLRDLRPNSAVLVGIAAAVDTSEIALGDVPISSQVLSYDDIAVEDGTLTFRSEGFQVDPAMILGVGKLRTSTETYLPWQRCCQATIRQVISDVNQLRRKPIILPETQDPPHLVVGVTAGGPILLRDQDFRDSLRKPQTLPNHAVVKLTSPLHPKLISVEMESHGFMRAAHQYSVPASVVKGISDIGDARKTAVEKRTGGFFRAYACCNAVIATLHAIDFRRRSLLPT